jgi:catechol-2,3-dioxygenase
MLQNHPVYAYIPARDLERARRFYEDKIGLKPTQEIKGGVVYEFAGGTACFLYPTPNAGTSKASQAFWQGGSS